MYIYICIHTYIHACMHPYLHTFIHIHVLLHTLVYGSSGPWAPTSGCPLPFRRFFLNPKQWDDEPMTMAS